MKKIHLTFSQEKLVAEWISEISETVARPASEISDQLIRDITSMFPDLNPVAAGELYFEKIRELRFPRQTQSEKNFKKAASEIADSLENSISFRPSQGFELEQLEINLKISTENLDQVLDCLNSNREKIRKLLFLT